MYQPKTGEICYCKKGVQRDNCITCEGTGQRINFKAIRNHIHEFKTGISKKIQTCKLGSILNFILLNEDENMEVSIYERLRSNGLYLQANNYSKLITKGNV